MKEKKKSFKNILLKVFCLTICICLGVYVLLAIYIGSHVYDASDEHADAIIILGARVKYGDKINPCLQARIDEGASLFKDGRAPNILVSGGDEEDGSNEADSMRLLLIERGVDPFLVWEEKKSTSTYENLRFSKEILKEHEVKKIILVSEPFHLPRAKMIAQSLGIEASVSPATNSPCWTRWKFLSRYFLLEPIKYVNDWVKLNF